MNSKFKLLFSIAVFVSGAWANHSSIEEIYIPKTADEALRSLHFTQADGHAWTGFDVGTFALFDVRASLADGKEDKFPMKEIVNRRTEQGIELVDVATLSGGVLRRDTRVEVEDRPELDPSKATKLSDEDVTIESAKYKTSVYEFSAEKVGEGHMRYKYWLAGGVPDGIVKVHVVAAEGSPNQYEVDSHLTEWNVPIKSGGRTLRCYCREATIESPGGSVTTTKTCRNLTVPGHNVIQEEVISNGSKVTQKRVETLTRYTIVRNRP